MSIMSKSQNRKTTDSIDRIIKILEKLKEKIKKI